MNPSSMILNNPSSPSPVTGALVIRQSGGVAGTDEVSISHNGTHVLIANAEAGDTYIGDATNFGVRLGGYASGNSTMFRNGWTDSVTLGNVASVTFSGNVAKMYLGGASRGSAIVFRPDAGGGSPDAGITSVAAGVVAPVSSTTGGTGSGWFQNTNGRSRVAGDVTNITTTFAAITGLSATLIAARKYAGRIVIKCNDSTAAEGIKFDLAGGAATMTSFAACASILTGGTAVAVNQVSSALNTALNWSTITNETWIVIEFVCVVNGAGTFIPQFAQNSHTSGTATVSLGSCMSIEDIP